MSLAGISGSIVAAFITWAVVSVVISWAGQWGFLIGGVSPSCDTRDPLCGHSYRIPEDGGNSINTVDPDIGIATALGLTKRALAMDYAVWEYRDESAIVNVFYWFFFILRLALLIGAGIGVFALIRG